MTVKELIEKLQTLDQDLLVVMSKDAEGNGFSPIYSASVGQYDEDNNEFRDNPEDLNDSFLINAVCLDPVN